MKKDDQKVIWCCQCRSLRESGLLTGYRMTCEECEHLACENCKQIRTVVDYDALGPIAAERFADRTQSIYDDLASIVARMNRYGDTTAASKAQAALNALQVLRDDYRQQFEELPWDWAGDPEQ